MAACVPTVPLLLWQDWNLLKTRAKNLSGRDEASMRGITKAEVRKHNSQHDCWSIFRGKVWWGLAYFWLTLSYVRLAVLHALLAILKLTAIHYVLLL